jgi:hypothetical protein
MQDAACCEVLEFQIIPTTSWQSDTCFLSLLLLLHKKKKKKKKESGRGTL